MNSTAIEARELRLRGKLADAADITLRALAECAHDPDLNAERGLQLCFSQNEFEAVPYWERAAGSCWADELGQVLADYLHCRRTLTHKLGIDDGEAIALSKRVALTPGNSIGSKLSACLIVKNEESNLERCLSSLKGICDEIVVVDTGSADRTVEIAKAHGAVIGHFAWCDDFAAARNAALDLATGQWALWIDADEELGEDCNRIFLEALSRPHFAGYYVQIINFLDDQAGANQYVHSAVRLFRRIPEIRFEGRIHEQVLNSFDQHGLIAATLGNATIKHYGYAPGVMEEKGKLDRTIEMLKREVETNPEDAFQLFNLANAYMVGKHHAETAETARKALPHLIVEMPFATVTYQLLASSLNSLGYPDEALRACDEAESRNFGSLLIDFERAHSLYKMGHFKEALASIELCVGAEWPTSLTGDRGIVGYKGKVLKAQILHGLGQVSEATALLDDALATDPTFAIALLARGRALSDLRRYAEAAADFQAVSRQRGFENAIALAGSAYLSAGILASAMECYLAAFKAIPSGDLAQAMQYCAESVEPAARFETFEVIAAAGFGDCSLYINWGRALAATGNLAEALVKYQIAINLEPQRANAYFNAGDLLYQLGAFGEAAKLYESGLRHDTGNAEGWFVLANALAQADFDEAAISAYNQVLTIDPGHRGAQFNRGLLAA